MAVDIIQKVQLSVSAQRGHVQVSVSYLLVAQTRREASRRW